MNRMKSLRSWAAGAACLLGAWLISLAVPSDVAWREGFAVVAEIGQPASDRKLEVTLERVLTASTLANGTMMEVGKEYEGSWVVFESTAQLISTERRDEFGYATLTIDGDEYYPQDRFLGALDTERLFIAAPSSGAFAFEIPAEHLDKPAVLKITTSLDHDNADSYLEWQIDLSQAEVVDTYTLEAVEVGK